MKRAVMALMGVAVGMLSGSEAFGIAAGPGGRIYATQSVDCDTDSSGANDTRYIRLSSYQVDENWNLVGVKQSHGDILDNCFANPEATGAKKIIVGISPEVLVSRGQGYADLVVGAWYNNSPLSVRGNNYQTMDVLRVTPSAGSMSISVLGDGKTSAQMPQPKATDGGIFALPDPAGQFTGSSANFVVNNGVRYATTAGGGYLWITTASPGNSDITNDDADYLAAVPVATNRWNGYSFGNEYEILGNKLFRGGGRYGGTIEYVMRHDNGSYSVPITWVSGRDSLPGFVNIALMTDYRFAVGVTRDGHEAAWAASYDESTNTWNKLGLFIDLNRDGDAMDNAAVTGTVDEYREIYFANSTANNWDNPSYIAWTDLEFIKGPTADFLMVRDSSYGIFVIQLADNGEFAGTGKATPGDYVKRITTDTQYNLMFEFDATVIPEPGTLLLAGTGAAGAIGYLRRRRMKQAAPAGPRRLPRHESDGHEIGGHASRRVLRVQ